MPTFNVTVFLLNHMHGDVDINAIIPHGKIILR